MISSAFVSNESASPGNSLASNSIVFMSFILSKKGNQNPQSEAPERIEPETLTGFEKSFSWADSQDPFRKVCVGGVHNTDVSPRECAGGE